MTGDRAMCRPVTGHWCTGHASACSVRSVLAQLQLADLVAVHLVRAVGEAQRARVGVGAGEEEVVGDAGGAVGLDRPVDAPAAPCSAPRP